MNTKKSKTSATGWQPPGREWKRGKRVFQCLMALWLFAGFSGCADDGGSPDEAGRVAVVLHGSRAGVARTTDSGDAWANDDRVGVFLVEAGGVLPDDIVADATNLQYIATPVEGNAPAATFAAASASDVAYYPLGTSVDIAAYYPWRAAVGNDGTFEVDLTDQSSPADIDVLHAKATGKDENSGEVNLVFRHAASKIVLDLKAGTGVTAADLAGAEVRINNVAGSASFSIAAGEISAAGQLASFDMKRETATPGFAATFSAILAPLSGGSGRSVDVIIGNRSTLAWDIPDATPFPAGTCYTYTVTVSDFGVTVGSGTIVPWSVPDLPALEPLGRAGISTAADLKAFADAWNTAATTAARDAVLAEWGDATGTVRLLADIDMAGIADFIPIGKDYDYRFTGTFDGGGHTISNLRVNVANNYAGLFGYNSGTIRDVNMADATVTAGYWYAGGIAGSNDGGTITGCSVTGGTVKAELYAGGITGSNNGTITGCSVTGAMVETDLYVVGGIAGQNNSTITACIAAPESVSGGGYDGIGICAGRNGGSFAACYHGNIAGLTAAGDGNGSGSAGFDKSEVRETGNFFTDAIIARMNEALVAAGVTDRQWTAGNAASGWYPVIE